MTGDARYPVPETEQDLRLRIAKLERINQALMAHVERATDQHEGAYSLFQTAIMLEGQVRSRTEELTALMHSLERSNEALQAAKEDAERANRSKTKFLAAASHDLLQPLNAARLASSTLAGMTMTIEAGRLATQIERGMQTIEDLIKTLLDISKLDAGVVVPVKKAVRLSTIMAFVEQNFRATAEQRHLRLVTRGADLMVESDATLLQRIVQNLVSNALRYTAEGGVVVAARARGAICHFDVIDSGIGIAPQEIDLVFEEFYRSKSAATSQDGLGLGLAIVRRMAQALGHELKVRSRIGHGSSFRLILPLTDAAQEDDDLPMPIADISYADADLLVFENDAATREALTRLLQSWGLNVAAFADAESWRASRADKPAPSLVLADYHLDNDATGLDAIAGVRAALGRPVPAIITTADHSGAVERRVSDAGCKLMHKPVRPAELRALLSFLLPPATIRRTRGEEISSTDDKRESYFTRKSSPE